MVADGMPPQAAGGRPRLAAVGAGRMGRGIAVAFAYAGHRIALVDLRPRDAPSWSRLRDEAMAEIRAHAHALARLGALRADQVEALCARVRPVPADEALARLAPYRRQCAGLHHLLSVVPGWTAPGTSCGG